MSRLRRPALILGVVCAAGAAGAAAPPPAGSVQVQDSGGTADTLAAEVDSAGRHAAMLDSLSRRTAAVRASVMRLSALHGVRAQRIESGLRLRLPFPGAEPGRPLPNGELAPVLGVAELARRHYPGTPVTVVGTAGAGGPACGTAAERRRARTVATLLREAGGLDPTRVSRGDCSRETEAGAVQLTAAPALDGPGVTVYIEWEGRDGSS